ncbi:protein DENND6A-like [Tropilaelaps mercedesae]|uniref:Protein DENND6A-like n=1 Tax=Tropilaelaps mercedesae TaxID=418985 RepID=A0A1V9X0E4_9ACAR|nr:protein DENND6A-like [Tropilaelaps mercedesae]
MPAFTGFGKKVLLPGCGCCCEPGGGAAGLLSPMELQEMRYIPRRPNDLALDGLRGNGLPQNGALEPAADHPMSLDPYPPGPYPLPVMSPALSGCTVSSSDQQWERYSEWLHCIAVVTFDLELGQAIENVYPPCATLSEQEKLNICYLAFPDSNSACMGDTQFHFRIRREDKGRSMRLTEDQLHFNDLVPPALQIDADYLYGFAYFRQLQFTGWMVDTDRQSAARECGFARVYRLPFRAAFLQGAKTGGKEKQVIILTAERCSCPGAVTKSGVLRVPRWLETMPVPAQC